MSHIKNLQSFDKVIAICTGLGGNYNPGKQNLQLASLTTLLNSAQAALENIRVAKTNYEYATNYREVAFEGLSKLVGRIISELKSSVRALYPALREPSNVTKLIARLT